MDFALRPILLKALPGVWRHLWRRYGAAWDAASLRGVEGDAAATYFGALGELILRNQDEFAFSRRARRPPTDPVNAMLSLFYTVLMMDCASALEGVGLDSYVGVLHTDRPGRRSLALDLMEERGR